MTQGSDTAVPSAISAWSRPTGDSKGVLSGRTILVVEDEMMVLMSAEDMLFDLGCRSIMTAATVAQALSLIEAGGIEVALLDLNLGGDRSFAIADELSRRKIPFAFATGYGAHGLRLTDDGRYVLMKPYRASDLAETLASLLT